MLHYLNSDGVVITKRSSLSA